MSRGHRRNFAYLDHVGPIPFAHRGGDAAGADKENTMAAFKAAHTLGFRYMETDVILSADGQVVAIHGAKNEKDEEKTKLPLRSVLQGLEYAVIKRKYKIGGEDIPLLSDLFDEFDDIRVNIDPKTPEVVEPLGVQLRNRGLTDRVCIGSFSYKRTQGVAEILGGQDRVCTVAGPVGAIALKVPLLVPGYLKATEAACLQLPYKSVTANMVERAADQGLAVHVWTVDKPFDINTALDNGANGVMSDDIRTLKGVMQARDAWTEAS